MLSPSAFPRSPLASPRNQRGTGGDAHLMNELGAAIHLQLESLLHLVGGESGAVLQIDAAAESISIIKQPSLARSEDLRSSGSPAVTPTSRRQQQEVHGLFRTLAVVGSAHPSFRNESMHAGVVASGIAVHVTGPSPVLCFPLRSATVSGECVGVVVIANRRSEDSDFVESDEATTNVMARSLGALLSRYPTQHISKPYDAKRLRLLGSVPTLSTVDNVIDAEAMNRMREISEQRVFHTKTAHIFQKKGIVAERCDVPEFSHLQDFADYVSGLEAVVESQRATNIKLAQKERDAHAKLQVTHREFTAANQSLTRTARTNDALQATIGELQQSLQAKHVEHAINRRRPTDEIDHQVRDFLSRAKRGGANKAPGGQMPPPVAPPTTGSRIPPPRWRVSSARQRQLSNPADALWEVLRDQGSVQKL